MAKDEILPQVIIIKKKDKKTESSKVPSNIIDNFELDIRLVKDGESQIYKYTPPGKRFK